jgi:hypothetical protein
VRKQRAAGAGRDVAKRIQPELEIDGHVPACLCSMRAISEVRRRTCEACRLVVSLP